jgi:hypothetical protein
MSVVSTRELGRTSIDLRIALVLASAGAVAVVAVFPYVLGLLPAEQRAGLPPLAVLIRCSRCRRS